MRGWSAPCGLAGYLPWVLLQKVAGCQDSLPALVQTDPCQVLSSSAFLPYPQATSGPGMWLPQEKKCQHMGLSPFFLASKRTGVKTYQVLWGGWWRVAGNTQTHLASR